MANGRPGDSITHDVVHHRIPTFGPTCDALIRDIASRLPPARMRELHDIVEPWPFAADGAPRDTDLLFERLTALRACLGASLSPEPPPELPADPMPTGTWPRRSYGPALLLGLLAFMVGGTLGAILALLLAGIAPSGDAAMGWAIGQALAACISFLLVGGAASVWTARRAWPR